MNGTNSSDKIIFTVTAEYDNSDIKSFLRKECKISSRLLKKLKLIYNGILLNGKHAYVTHTINTGDTITLTLPSSSTNVVCSEMQIDVLYEDDEIIIFDKPAGVTVHPVHDYVDNTLANFAMYHARKNNKSYIFRAINRLDKDTSGCVVCAKNAYIANLIKNSVNKTYFAVCEGVIEKSGTINKQIRLKSDSKMVREAVFEGGKESITHYKPISGNSMHTLLEINLETGRTHQIRVHMSDMGFPLAGDDLYGGSLEFISRQALHCGRVTLINPVTKKLIDISSKIPDDMMNVLK